MRVPPGTSYKEAVLLYQAGKITQEQLKAVKNRGKGVSGPAPGRYVPHPGGSAVGAITKGKGKTVHGPGGFPVGTPINVKGLQKQLKAAGYDIKVDGVLGKRTKSALRDFLKPSKKHPLSPEMEQLLRGAPISGKRNPKSWNQKYGVSSRVNKPVDKTLTDAGVPPRAGGGAGAAGGGGGGDGMLPPIDLSGLLGIDVPNPRLIPEAWAQGGARDISADFAAKLADLEYGSAISEALRAQRRGTAQNAQNIHDIDQWFGQVSDSQAKAMARDAAMGKASVDSMRDVSAALVSSLGGSANEGSGMVAAAGAQNTGTLGALAAAQDQYNSDMAPLLKAESAGALSREKAMGSQRAADLAASLVNLQKERDNAEAARLFDIKQYNNQLRDQRLQNRIGIRTANQAAAQQGFSNRMSVEQARLAAAVSGAKIVTDTIKANAAAAGKGPKTFAQASASQRKDAYNRGVIAVAKSGYDKDGNPINIPIFKTPQRALAAVKTILNNMGWSIQRPAVRNFALAILREAGYHV